MARRVMPAVLQRLMRHGNIQTTMGYYLALDADEVAAGLWADYEPNGNKPGNTEREEAPAATRENLT